MSQCHPTPHSTLTIKQTLSSPTSKLPVDPLLLQVPTLHPFSMHHVTIRDLCWIRPCLKVSGRAWTQSSGADPACPGWEWRKDGPPGENSRYDASTTNPCSQGSQGPRARTHKGEPFRLGACLSFPVLPAGGGCGAGQLRVVQVPTVPTQVSTPRQFSLSPLLYPRPWGICTSEREGIKARPPRTCANLPRGPSTPSPCPWFPGPAGEEEARLAGVSPLLLPPGPGYVPSKPEPATQVNKLYTLLHPASQLQGGLCS